MLRKFRGTGILMAVMFLVACKTQWVTTGEPTHALININSTIAGDTALERYIAPYREQMEKEMNIVIGEAANALTRQYTAHETTMGNFFSDAILAIGQQLDPTVQMSFATKGGIRTDIQKGPVTIANIFELMPFDNKLVVITITGEKMKKLFDNVVKAGGQPMGGIRLTLTNTSCEDVMIQGEAFDEKKNYTIITYDYLADGGDGVSFFHDPIRYQKYDVFVREALIEYVKSKTAKGEKISAQIDNRIKDVRK